MSQKTRAKLTAMFETDPPAPVSLYPASGSSMVEAILKSAFNAVLMTGPGQYELIFHFNVLEQSQYEAYQTALEALYGPDVDPADVVMPYDEYKRRTSEMWAAAAKEIVEANNEKN